MGYSFCNCVSVFYTRPSNLVEPVSTYIPDQSGIITLPDPFFAWPNPYDFHYWNVRKYELIWPMDSLCQEYEDMGYEIISAKRDFNPNSETPQHYRIEVKKK